MEQLGIDLNDLGYDLLGLENLVYFGCGFDQDHPPDCGSKCTGGCTGGCYRCSPGNKND